MIHQDADLDEEPFDMAATRPPMTMGLPHTLSVTLLFVGVLFVMLYGTGDLTQDLTGDAIAIGVIGMVWSAAKLMLRDDYHGWDNFVAWLRLDARCLDTKQWGGAHLSSFPQGSPFRCEVLGNDE